MYIFHVSLLQCHFIHKLWDDVPTALGVESHKNRWRAARVDRLLYTPWYTHGLMDIYMHVCLVRYIYHTCLDLFEDLFTYMFDMFSRNCHWACRSSTLNVVDEINEVSRAEFWSRSTLGVGPHGIRMWLWANTYHCRDRVVKVSTKIDQVTTN